ncbi:hypothetical protein D3C81_07330 [compost metagenome]
MKKTVLYRGKVENGYSDFYPTSRMLCIFEQVTTIEEVEIIEDSSSTTWVAWWDNKLSRFSLVFENRKILEICFPYGSKVDTEKGLGEVLGIRLQVLKEIVLH